jgi:hypothetical protein
MFSFIKKFFGLSTVDKSEGSLIKQLVIFDGDQCHQDTFLSLYKDCPSTKFLYVAISISKVVRRFCKANPIEVIQPYHIGKEATDNQIAISLVCELSKNPSIKMVHIVSNDGDFYDIMKNTSRYFPSVKFVLVSDQRTATSKTSHVALRKLCLEKDQKCFHVLMNSSCSSHNLCYNKAVLTKLGKTS